MIRIYVETEQLYGKELRYMNISEAKKEIRNTVEVYLEKDECGEYVVPYARQRPVLLIGAPGIGKTAIVEQIAAELDVALVCCSMTHYTRQSALGRPLVREKKYIDKTYPVAEYTLGDIMQSIYAIMERSGRREGILFLSEINCAAESLISAVRQVLQKKMIGNCQIPEGWVVVAAASPAKYNHAAKAFCVSTLDRVRCLNVEEDYETWKAYVCQGEIHAAVISFLDLYSDNFYSVQAAGRRSRYVTARGWYDLSEAILAYEKKGFSVNNNLILQYVSDSRTAVEFAAYYERFQKVQKDNLAKEIFEKGMSEEIRRRIEQYGEEEKTALQAIVAQQSGQMISDIQRRERILRELGDILESAEKEILQEGISLTVILESVLEQLQSELGKKQAAHCILNDKKTECRKIISYLKRFIKGIEDKEEPEKQLSVLKKRLDILASDYGSRKEKAEKIRENIENFLLEI